MGFQGSFSRLFPRPSRLVTVMPLVLKRGLLAEEAAGLKSALLTWLYKNKGARNCCASCRAIMLLPVLTKVIHRAFRPRIYEHVAAHVPPILLGASGGHRMFGSRIVRLFCQWSVASKRPACVLFADVASAYYDSIRDLTARCSDHSGQPVRTFEHAPEAAPHDGLVATPWRRIAPSNPVGPRPGWSLLRLSSIVDPGCLFGEIMCQSLHIGPHARVPPT